MPIVQNLYQIFKIPASYIVKNNCKIDSYTFTQGQKEGNVVSIGDNIVFQQLRYIHNNNKNHVELFNYVQKLREHVRSYKKQSKYKEAHILEHHISDVLFVKDIINVVVDQKKSDFHKFRTKGFDFNGEHYVYLCSGSGQIRRNTATFVNEKYHDQLVKTLNCGLDEKTSEFVLAKYSAYFALSFSSVLWVRTPRVCVIKDFFRELKDEKVDFICKNKEGKSIIEERKMNLELNCADGQGLIDPYFAQLWSQDMNLSYTPCSFVARSCFIKGNLVTFDFKDYARQHNIFQITDRWGKTYNINDIDVLLSESQFKTYKYYSSWQEYCKYAEAGNIQWGVARYNKKRDAENILANYQYIQSLSLTTEDIQSLIKPSVDWIQKVCSGDPLFALLYSFGSKTESVEYQNVWGQALTSTTKAIIKNCAFLKDSYVQRKIYKNITESINHAKIGKIWIRGNYQFCIADPLAQCQSALGLDPVGGVGRDQVWSKFWVDRGVKRVDLCRSPMIDVHEHNPCDIYTNEDLEYWYRFINSGIIYSTYDTSCFRQEDSDYDGDIVLSTDNEYFIKGSHKNHNIITYEKGLALPSKMTTSNITKTVLKGFGTGVGGFSNTATILYAMAAIFDKPGHEDQYQEIMTRIKLLREIVGQEIDRIKGADKPSLPKEWKKYEQISPSDTQEEITAKIRRNAMVVAKKPYFFRYLYEGLNQKYKQFEASYNQVSRDTFGIKFKKLLKKEDKTPEEKELVRRYQKYSPLITAPCTMNKLCREIESIDFDIKFNKDADKNKKKNISLLPTYESVYAASYSDDKLLVIKKLYQKYTSQKAIKVRDNLFAGYSIDEDDSSYIQSRKIIFDSIITDCQQELASHSIQNDEFLFYCNRLSQSYSQFNWGFAWEILGDSILKLIPQGKSIIPVRSSSDLGIEYLGEFYELKDITNIPDMTIQKLIDSIFGSVDIPSDPEVDRILSLPTINSPLKNHSSPALNSSFELENEESCGQDSESDLI